MSKRRKMTFEERQKLAQELIAADLDDYNLDILGPSTKRRKSLKTPGEKLTNYHIFVDDSVFWGSRQAFLKLIQSFLCKQIDGETFTSKFFRLRSQSMAKAEEICERIEDNIQPILDLNYTSKAVDFGSEIADLFFEIDRFDPDIEDSDWNDYVYSESKLRSVIKEGYLPGFLESCDLDDSFFQPRIDLDQLIERSYKIVFSVAILVIGFLLANFIWIPFLWK